MVEFKAGDRVNNRYEIQRKLGAGAMGSVYEAFDLVENRIRVALKVLISDTIEDQDLWARGEYEALTRLRHPNLARMYDFGRIQGTRDYFISSEFIKGLDLYRATEYTNYEDLTDIVVQICRALEYIHSQGYVHFDIKPDNILVTRHKCATIKEGSKAVWTEESAEDAACLKPNVKLIDFGLAEKLTGSFDFAIKGTLNYLAPEMIDGGKPDRRADLYSLGVTLYQIVNRDLPFYHDTGTGGRALKRSELFEIHMKKLPEYLRAVTLRLLAEKPEERFQSAKEVIEALSSGSGVHYELETPETRSSYLHTTTLVGRQDEFNALKEYARGVFPQIQNRLGDRLEGKLRPPLILVSGEIGSGKSRLVEEFRHFLRLNYVQVYAGNCYEGRNDAYQPIVEILRQLATHLGREHAVFQRYKDALLRLLPEFRTKEDNEKPLGLRPDQEKLYFIDRIVHFLIDASRDQPFTMLLNNLHWADEMSVELLGYFLQNVREEDGVNPHNPLGLLVVATFRTDEKIPDNLRELLGSLREEKHCEEIVMRRFKRDRVKELVSAMLHLADIPDDFITAVAERTAGNPLFVVEMLKSFQELGIIRSSGSGWKVAPTAELSAIDVPANVELALLRRLENLEVLGRELMEVLAVAERAVAPNLLGLIPRFGQAPVLNHLNELEDKGFVASQVRDGEKLFGLDQPTFQEMIYRALPEAKRRRVHGEFADALRVAFAKFEDEVLEELAHHYRFSDRPDTALELALRVGDRLKRIYANEKAYEYYAYAAEMLAERELGGPQWVQTQEYMGELCLTLGRFDEATRIYNTLLGPDIAPKLGPVARGRFARQRGRVCEILGDYDHALHCYRDARDVLSAAGQESPELQLEKIWAINALGGLYVRMGKCDRAMKISIEALKIIESTSETIEHAVVFTTIGGANYYKGNLPQAIEFQRRSLEIQEKLQNVPEMILTLNSLGKSHQANAEFGEAEGCFRRAMALSDEIGDSYGRALSYNSLGWFYLEVGDLDKAEEAQAASLRLSRNYRMRQLSQENYVLQGLILQGKGEYTKAEASLFRALTALAKQGNRWELCSLLLKMAELHLKTGKHKDAERMVQDAERLSEDLGMSNLRILCALQRGRLLRVCGSAGEALDVLRSGLALVTGEVTPELTGELSYELGETLLVLRKVEEAEQFFSKAAEKAKEVLARVPAELQQAYRAKRAAWMQGAPLLPETPASPPPPPPEPPPRRKETEIREETQRLELVTRLTAEFASGIAPEECLFHALAVLTAYLRAQYGFLLRVEDEEQVRILLACDKDGKRVSQPSALVASELIGDVLGGQPIFCTNTVDDARTNEYESVFTHNLRAVVVTPLKAAGAVAGMLYIANPAAQATQDKLKTIVSSFVPIFALGLLQCRATAR